MTDIIDLERRVAALEVAQKHTAETQEWMAATLGRIAAVQDRHGKVLDSQTMAIAALQSDVRRIETKIDGLATNLPVMLADAVREGLKGR